MEEIYQTAFDIQNFRDINCIEAGKLEKKVVVFCYLSFLILNV